MKTLKGFRLPAAPAEDLTVKKRGLSIFLLHQVIKTNIILSVVFNVRILEVSNV
ncbi:hypothetical protein SD77_1214 [Bacillus badius]|uniref:Uncharacterized protein n=1 Tax=Bacillus badius TaxID=1455 RepID=A0ABR5AS04_BACBA|nr:hypothetical protein SD78_3185 [Bacillus badius]KIL77541.1 hypothetical protein SD77_1214 [Bacillus badius]